MSNRKQNTAPVGHTALTPAPTWATSSEHQSESTISSTSDSIDLGRVEHEWPSMSVALLEALREEQWAAQRGEAATA